MRHKHRLIMVGFDTIFTAVLPVFMLVAIGWSMRRWGGLTAEGEQSLMRVVVNLLFPAFTFSFVLGNPLLRDPKLLVQAGLTGYLTIAIGCLIAFRLAPLFGLKEPVARRSFSVATGVHNFGYIAIPVAQLFFDAETIGVMLVVNASIDLAIWTIGVMTISGVFDKKALRRALNAPVIALISSVTLNFFHAETWLPDFIQTGIHMLAPCAIPVGLIMVGTAFYGLTGHLRGGGYWRTSLGAVLIRQGLLPLVILLLAKYLPLEPALKSVILVHAAMPTGVFPVVLCKYYGGSTVTAIQCILPSALFGFVTIPLWVQFGFWWLG